ncbi:MAG: C40 family peptidase [Lachnospiraceae bacterium]|nr:C40 family peptidase [Lachnospiraceae bacterium]
MSLFSNIKNKLNNDVNDSLGGGNDFDTSKQFIKMVSRLIKTAFSAISFIPALIIIIILIIIAFFSSIIAALEFGGGESVKDAVNEQARFEAVGNDGFYFDEDTNEEVMSDAGTFLAWLDKHPDFSFEEDINSVQVDLKTFKRILKAVDNYNKNVQETKTISYEYMVYEGDILSFDDITGEVTLGPVTATVEEAGWHEELRDFSIKDWIPKTDAEIKKKKDILDKINKIPSPLDREEALKGYPKVHGYGRVWHDTSTKSIDPTSTSKTGSVTLSKKNIDTDPAIMGEDLFYMHWQPVYALCCMFITQNTENFGEYEESDVDGESYYLSDEDIENIIDIFEFKFVFYDELMDSSVKSISFNSIFSKSQGYRLETEPSIEEIKKSISSTDPDDKIYKLTVKRIPSVAPAFIANSYLSYNYNYNELSNPLKYFNVASRTAKLDPVSFYDSVMGLMPEEKFEFEFDFFLEILEGLPGSYESVEHFLAIKDLYDNNTSNISNDSSAISGIVGTKVSRVDTSGLLGFFKNRNGLIQSIDLSGHSFGTDTGYTAVNFNPSLEAMSDLDFAEMYKYIENCLIHPTKYAFGENGGPGVNFDCSSFVAYVLKSAGYNVNGYPNGRETCRTLYNKGTTVYTGNASDVPNVAKPGDIILFSGTQSSLGAGIPSHVAIWVGDGRFAHASSSAKKVVIGDWDDYRKKHFHSIVRFSK